MRRVRVALLLAVAVVLRVLSAQEAPAVAAADWPMVNGVMYINTATSVVALEAHTGKELWRYEVPMGPPSKRGVGYWPGTGASPARILFTSGGRLFALNAVSGQLVSEFGSAGIVDMGQTYNGSPTVYVIVNVSIRNASASCRQTSCEK